MQNDDKKSFWAVGCAKRWNDSHLTETNGLGGNAPSRGRQIIFIAMTDFFNQPMAPQAIEQLRNRAAAFLQPPGQVFVLK